MAFMDELKRLVRPYNEDEDDYDEEETEEEGVEEEPVAQAPVQRTVRTAPAAAAPAAQPAARPAATVSAPALGGSSLKNSATTLQMILVKPEQYDEVSGVADHLRNHCAVVLNLEATDRASAKRIVDFLSGCAYALDGNIKKVATSTYVITPSNVDVEGDLNAQETVENTSITY